MISFAEASSTFHALGDPTRLEIVARLSDGESRSITSLSSDFDLTRQAVTKHLRVLEMAGLVTKARIGRESRFELEPRGMTDAREFLETVSKDWDLALGRLQSLVERNSDPG